MVTLDQAGRARDRLVTTQPPRELADLVELFWIDDRHRSACRIDTWRVVADDAPHIIYYRYSDPVANSDRHRLHIVGARERYADVDCTNRLFTVGARLRPGAIPALFGMPAHELTNRALSADLLVRSGVLDRFTGDGPFDARAEIERLVRELARRGNAVDRRTRALAHLRASSGESVSQFASASGVTDRALRSWSARHLGLGLKRFLSIRRLHSAIESRIVAPQTTWSRIAAAHGFADQSHLVRDCQAMLGESPSEFLARAG